MKQCKLCDEIAIGEYCEYHSYLDKKDENEIREMSGKRALLEMGGGKNIKKKIISILFE